MSTISRPYRLSRWSGLKRFFAGWRVLAHMQKFFLIACVLLTFIITGVVLASVRTTIQHDLLAPPHMQEGSCHMARPHDGRPVPDCAF